MIVTFQPRQHKTCADGGNELRDELKAKLQSAETRTSRARVPIAMTEIERFKGATPAPTPEQREEAERNLEREAKERAEASG